MSQQRVARRSASHGALSNSYVVQGQAGSDSGHYLPPFRPLRSIREHTFLDPAASAEGMLRKTTETGNIGIFSINVTRSNDQLFRRPNGLRARASLNDLHRPPRPFSRSSDRLAGRDDRKQLPSYRDSTSEIISMYGSENHSSKSVSSSLTTPCDEYGPRSYSMTSCGPRGCFIPRYNGSQHSQEYPGRIQRPRSPYPYPTRLPRHDVRPASPALTISGDVDYSRMVAIDRVSHRTTHHPYKTLFPCKTTRSPLPLSLRQDANLSTRSFSDHHVTTRANPPRPRNQPPLPSHLHEWGGRPRERLESGSSDQSLRTMSLTSMSGGYGQFSSRMRGITTVPRKPLFYDYSENFEDIVEPPPPVVPIAPIPRRVSNSYRPAAAQNDSGANSECADDAQNEFVAYLHGGTTTSHHADESIASAHNKGLQMSSLLHDSVTSPQGAPEGLLESYPSTETAVPIRDCDALAQVLDDNGAVEHGNAMKNIGQTKELTVVETKSDASTLDDLSEPKTPGFNANVPFHEVLRCDEGASSCTDCHEGRMSSQGVDPSRKLDKLPSLTRSASISFSRPHLTEDASTLPKGDCHPRHDSRFYSSGSGLSDLASFVQQVDQHFQTTGPEDIDVIFNESRESHGWTQTMTGITSAKNRPRPWEDKGLRSEQRTNAVPHPPRVSSLRENRRQPAALRVDTAVDEPHQYQIVSTRSGPTLTPQPISPAKQLRVKNSIPQLMKALPPLPGYAPAPESPFGPAVVPMEFEPFEISQLTDARSTLIEAFQAEDASKGYDAFVFDRNTHKPRLKLKHATSFAVGNERNLRREHIAPKSVSRPDASIKRPATATETATETTTEYSTAPVKRRLPIKISRPMLTSLVHEDAGTVKRRPGIQKSSTVSELTSKEPIDLFSSAVALRAAVAKNDVCSAQQKSLNAPVQANEPIVKITPVVRIQQIPADADTRGTSLDAHMDKLRLPSVDSHQGVEHEIRSFFSDNSIVKPRQGLRKRISNLKSKLAETRNHHRSPLGKLPQDDRHGGNSILLTPEGQPSGTRDELFKPAQASKAHPQVINVRTVRSKLGKFMKGAKHKLRTWGKSKRRID
ncbi:hypothetical protein N8I77_004259 [Diaporthe amygdali]|uniref:Uncharacterized protein n=1 Tax=Phomopsis amygdali TaxID=1214568 RepID=A0AAD9SLK6_PHOAM|nr:hypothetical protein N8I77_004259 [Diaporthe amygdali]